MKISFPFASCFRAISQTNSQVNDDGGSGDLRRPGKEFQNPFFLS